TYGRPTAAGVERLPLGLAKRYSWSGPRVAPLVILVIATSREEAVIACAAATPADLSRPTAACGPVGRTAPGAAAAREYPGARPAAMKRSGSAARGAVQSCPQPLGSSSCAASRCRGRPPCTCRRCRRRPRRLVADQPPAKKATRKSKPRPPAQCHERTKNAVNQ